MKNIINSICCSAACYFELENCTDLGRNVFDESLNLVPEVLIELWAAIAPVYAMLYDIGDI